MYARCSEKSPVKKKELGNLRWLKDIAQVRRYKRLSVSAGVIRFCQQYSLLQNNFMNRKGQGRGSK